MGYNTFGESRGEAFMKGWSKGADVQLSHDLWRFRRFLRVAIPIVLVLIISAGVAGFLIGGAA